MWNDRKMKCEKKKLSAQQVRLCTAVRSNHADIAVEERITHTATSEWFMCSNIEADFHF